MRWFSVVLLMFAASSCGDTGTRDARETSDVSDVKEIEALYASWREAVESSDIEGYLAVLHPDVRLLPPGADAIDGRDNYGQFLQPVFATATYEIEIERLQEIDVLGEAAVAEYDYTIVLHRKNPDVGVSEPGALTANRTSARYFDVLRKTERGKWLVWRHAWQEK